MNIFESSILLSLKNSKKVNQRDLSINTGFSLGQVNKSLQVLKELEFLTQDYLLTHKAQKLLTSSTPKNAIILAAGYGMRMVPINTECPKGLLTVNNEHLIDRTITQLHEKNINDITVVVGFMKESYEYLIDKYNVKLIYNSEFSTKNNLHSLKCVVDRISNTYIIPCDIWCSANIFSEYELYSWYSVTEIIDKKSSVRITRQQELESIKINQSGNKMIGISYITEADSKQLKHNILELCKKTENDTVFWEKALFDFHNIEIKAKLLKSTEVVEINSYEQLRELDFNSKELQNESLDIISQFFNCKNKEIVNIQTLKKGMTNRSYIFCVNNNKYIMRIPGEGTDLLINRKQEAQVYNTIKDYNICDKLFYINPDNGYKISKFLENSRVCNPLDITDLRKCMKKLRSFHDMNLQVNHTFEIFGQIDFYESLWNGESSCFRDYAVTKEHIFSLKPFVEATRTQWCLTHIDAVPDNFLFSSNEQDVQLIDWEYAGMQDPHVDIAMFCIYSLYDSRELVDQLIDCYFTEGCSDAVRTKIYCYIAICGLLWSNWCEYKRQLGVEFGEYSLRQYRFAKDYYKIAKAEIEKLGDKAGDKNA